MNKTKLIFVRHGEAEGNFYRIFHGTYNSNLTARGHLQASLTAKYLINKKIDIIYSSDMRRTIDTVGYIARQKGLTINTDEGLREIDGGSWETRPWSEFPSTYPDVFSRWDGDIDSAILPEGESVAELQKRIIKTVDKIVADNIGKTICIATHGTAIRCLVAAWKNKPIQTIPWYDNASVTIAEYTQNGYNLILEGENRHFIEYSTLSAQDWWKK